MTVGELIGRLQALPPQDRALDVCFGPFNENVELLEVRSLSNAAGVRHIIVLDNAE